jgi:hypothetical protein
MGGTVPEVPEGKVRDLEEALKYIQDHGYHIGGELCSEEAANALLSATARENTMNNEELSIVKDENCVFNFCLGNPHREIMRLDAEGMTYKAQRIDDAGEAHRAFLETMRLMKSSMVQGVGE